MLSGFLTASERVDRIELLSAEERSRITGWSGLGVAPTPGALLPDLIAEQAARTPDAVAVSWQAAAPEWCWLVTRFTVAWKVSQPLVLLSQPGLAIKLVAPAAHGAGPEASSAPASAAVAVTRAISVPTCNVPSQRRPYPLAGEQEKGSQPRRRAV